MKVTVEQLLELHEECWSEHQHQVRVMQWAKDNEFRFPELALLHANVNGERRTTWQAAQKVAEGMKSGLPDLHLPVPRGGKPGLWIEMKSKRGGKKKYPNANQRAWLESLDRLGHETAVCWTWREAVAVLEAYLDHHKRSKPNG